MFRKFSVFCFLETPVLRFVLLLQQSKEIKRNWTLPENFDLLKKIDHYYQRFISGIKVGH